MNSRAGLTHRILKANTLRERLRKTHAMEPGEIDRARAAIAADVRALRSTRTHEITKRRKRSPAQGGRGRRCVSFPCDCGEQIEAAMTVIEKAGSSSGVYVFDEGPGIGLLNTIRAYAKIENAEVPPGSHRLFLRIADSKERATETELRFVVGSE